MNREIISSVVKQSIPILIIAMLLGIVAGQILNLTRSIILFPWVLFIIPVINGIGGNLGTIIGARLSSGLHIGYISPQLQGKPLEKNLLTGIALGITTYLTLAIFSVILAPLLVWDMNVDLLRFALVIVMAGSFLTFVVLSTSMLAAITSFKFGLDPDNVVAPLTASTGDIVGILCIIFSIMLVGI